MDQVYRIRYLRKFEGKSLRNIAKIKEAYFPLEHPPGEAQVDFGSATFIENRV